MSSPYLNSPTPLGRPISRPSSRNSMTVRSQSPIVTPQDDAIAIRTQMSTLKHNIRQQQAQLHNLENNLRNSRTVPAGILSSPPMTPDELDNEPSSSGHSHSHTPSSASSSQGIKLQRRSSYEVLSGLAGPDSNLPLPRPNGNSARPSSYTEESPMSIREGIPATSPSKVCLVRRVRSVVSPCRLSGTRAC